jgi:hypothetical protein
MSDEVCWSMESKGVTDSSLPNVKSLEQEWNEENPSYYKYSMMGFFPLRHRVQTDSGAHPAS